VKSESPHLAESPPPPTLPATSLTSPRRPSPPALDDPDGQEAPTATSTSPPTPLAPPSASRDPQILIARSPKPLRVPPQDGSSPKHREGLARQEEHHLTSGDQGNRINPHLDLREATPQRRGSARQTGGSSGPEEESVRCEEPLGTQQETHREVGAIPLGGATGINEDQVRRSRAGEALQAQVEGPLPLPEPAGREEGPEPQIGSAVGVGVEEVSPARASAAHQAELKNSPLDAIGAVDELEAAAAVVEEVRRALAKGSNEEEERDPADDEEIRELSESSRAAREDVHYVDVYAGIRDRHQAGRFSTRTNTILTKVESPPSKILLVMEGNPQAWFLCRLPLHSVYKIFKPPCSQCLQAVQLLLRHHSEIDPQRCCEGECATQLVDHWSFPLQCADSPPSPTLSTSEPQTPECVPYSLTRYLVEESTV
jgi:hypothetical protein